jgi:predicted ATP-grasp superfamily ATP-dependent carboligase
MKPHGRVLVLDIGEAPYSLSVARSLGSAGYTVEYGFPLGSPQREAVSKHCAGTRSYPDPAYAPTEFQRVLVELAPTFDCIIPTKEKTLLATAQIRSELEGKGPLVPIAEYDKLLTATDKLQMLKLAESAGIHTPRTIVAEKPPPLQELAAKLGLPFVMKVSSEIGLRPIERHCLVETNDEPAFATKFSALVAHGPVVIQEYVQGTGAGVALLYSRAGNLTAFSGHRRRFEQFSDGGPSLLAQTSVDPRMVDQSRRLMELLRWEGIAMVEFRVNDSGDPVFMEVNPRFWGTLPLAIASGVDFPRLLVETHSAPQPRPPVHPSRVQNYFSFEVLVTSLTSPLEKRPKLTPIVFQLAKSLRGLSIREVQGGDLRPSVEEFFHLLRARGVKQRISEVAGVYLGPAQDYQALLRHGVRTVFDLREAPEIARLPISVPSGMDRVGFPIEDDTGIDPQAFSKLAALMARAAEAGPIYVHCRLGRGRAPMAVIGYLVSKGIPTDAAFQRVYAARPYANLNSAQKAAIYLFAQSRPPRAGE